MNARGDCHSINEILAAARARLDRVTPEDLATESLEIVQLGLYSHAMAGTTSESLNLDVLARVGLALADDSRRRLLVHLMDGPAYPSEIADDLGLTRANVSNHLACLRGCGLVVAEPEGRRVRYELSDPHLGHALRELLTLVLATDPLACPASDEGCC